MGPTGLLKPATTRPLSQWSKGALGKETSNAFIVGVRDNFNLTTWLLLGACMQSLLIFFVPSRFALAPAFLLIFYRLLDTVLMTVGLKRNRYIEESILGKFTAQMPDAEGRFSKEPANSEVCVFLIGARSNHPLGMFAPGFKQLGDYFNNMIADLEKHPEEYGFLGASAWLSSDRTAANELSSICYFRSADHLHKFAHGPLHREGWNWWNKNLAKFPHIGIMHELYQVPRSSWENIYINYHPTGLAATTYLTRTPAEATKVPEPTTTTTWVSPIVDASKGKLRSSAGRMARDMGDGNEKYGDDPYA